MTTAFHLFLLAPKDFFFSNEVYTLKLPAHISTAQSPNIVTTLRIKARGLPNIFLRFEAAEEEAALSPEAQIHFGTHLSCGLLICPTVHTRCSQSTHRDLVCFD